MDRTTQSSSPARETGRRQFLATVAGLAVVGTALGPGSLRAATDKAQAGFSMKFGPHFGMFEHLGGEDLLDQLSFAAGEGFTGWEDNGMRAREVGLQEKIAKKMDKLGIEMGVISALRGVWKDVNFSGDDAAARELVLKTMENAVEVARRVNTKYMTVVPGLAHPKLPIDYQTANCIELFKRCCDIVEPHGMTMVMEPLNLKTNHPGVFLHESPQAYLICKAVGRPSCKILFDIYHQQVTEGNLIRNMEYCWDEIGYFQSGDNPGRNEPGTGEINYKNIFKFLQEKGYAGVVGMEHGNSMPGPEGERAVIEAYRKVAPNRS